MQGNTGINGPLFQCIQIPHFDKSNPIIMIESIDDLQISTFIIVGLIGIILYLTIRLYIKARQQAAPNGLKTPNTKKQVRFEKDQNPQSNSFVPIPDILSVINYISRTNYKYFVLFCAMILNGYFLDLPILSRFVFVFIVVSIVQYIILKSYNQNLSTSNDTQDSKHVSDLHLSDVFHECSFFLLVILIITFGTALVIRKHFPTMPAFSDPGYYVTLFSLFLLVFFLFPERLKVSKLEISKFDHDFNDDLSIYSNIVLILLLIFIFSFIASYFFE